MRIHIDPLQTVILQTSAGVFVAAVCGTLTVVGTIRAVRCAAQLGRLLGARRRAQRKAAEEARIAAHVDTLMRQRVVREIDPEPITELLPVIDERDLRTLARFEQEFDRRRPLVNRRHTR